MRPPQHPHNRRQSTDDRNPEHELTSLNSTLNKFVGGQQKPWMTNANSTPPTTVSPPTKLPNPVPAPTHKSHISTPPGHSEKGKEIPSTSEKGRECTFSNSAQDQNASIAPSSEQRRNSLVSLGSLIQPGPVSPPASPDILNLQLAQTSTNAPTVDPQTTVFPSPDPSHDCPTRASSEVGPSDSSITGTAPFPQHQPACPQQLSGAQLQKPKDSSSSAIEGVEHSPLPPSPTPNIAINSPIIEGNSVNRPRIGPGNSATLQPYRPRNTAPANTQSTSDMMNRHQATLNLLRAETLSLKAFASILDRFSTTAPSGSYAASRISLLRNACAEDDLFYIVLHQVYCLSTVSRGSLDPAKFGAPQMAGLDIVSRLLVKNETLPIPFVKECAKFPAFFGDLIQHCSPYRKVLEEVTGFLEALANRWLPFEKSVISRGYPPLLDEMIAILGLTSPIFHHILFIACCRGLTVARDENLVQIYTGIFRKNQDFYRQRLSRMHSADPVSLAQMHLENAFLVQQYQQISQQHILQNRTLYRAVNSQQPQQFHGANFPITNANRPQAQTQGSITQAQQQIPIRHVYHQVRSSHPPITSNTTQRRPNSQQQCFMPTPSGPRPAIHSYTPAMAQPHPNPNLPLSSQFGHTSNNVNPRLPHGTFVHPSVQPPQANRTTSQPLYPKRNTFLLPPPGSVPMEIANPNPLIVGLHQAYLREKIVALDNNERGSRPPQLFQYLYRFAILPSSIRTHRPTFKWQFTIPPGEFQKLPVRLNASKHGSGVWGVSDGRQTYQLRCIKMDSSFPKLTEQQWAVSETVWPTAIYIHVNGTEHFVRRKTHHGRDLPLHITSSLKEGVNEISLTVLWGAAERKSESPYGMALEILEYASPSRVRSSIPHLQPSVSLEQIRKRLTGLNLDNDEIAVVDEHITINLVDPFMARIFDTPTRSKFCSHTECFDLETFLMTRLSNSVKRNGIAEDWKCPICNNDARPQFLIIDDFLVTVRRKLEEDKQLDDVKAILVHPDGSWEPKTERDINISSQPHSSKRKRESSEHEGSTSPRKRGQQLPHHHLSSKESSTPEVIELD
ncbi:hypothetical protein AJ78_05246 [Emergomyces pasteurianus Ep9510]|uniref:SP-RING-type domain-containing protein n=1 Tax=Emergomyces pasteurianus Ep9510 TaxID=1447872 RepID=A0A1J9QE37_9EURO|nr:hypothetical protein AJ78_05246 [Emergomyces pasteurianus Ep9510]